MNSRYVEIASLGVIAVLVALGGKLVLADLAGHRSLAASAFVVLIAGSAVGLRRTFRAPNDETRVVVTKYVAYIVAALLALWNLVAPAKWLPGSCIAATEVALVFDMLAIWARRPATGSGA